MNSATIDAIETIPTAVADSAVAYLNGLRQGIALSAVEWAAGYGPAAANLLRVHFIDHDAEQADRLAGIIQAGTPGTRTAKEYVDEFLAHAADALHAYMRLFELEPDWDLREDVAGYIKEDPRLIVPAASY